MPEKLMIFLFQKFNKHIARFIYFIMWIVLLIAIGSTIGSFTKPEIDTWYSTLNRSTLTPPNYVFPIAWTILYGIIGACGWLIWNAKAFTGLNVIKILYITQILLNWSWTPLFFRYHLPGVSLVVLSTMDILVSMIIWLTYSNIRVVALLTIPYLLWILFASYLNFYIFWCN